MKTSVWLGAAAASALLAGCATKPAPAPKPGPERPSVVAPPAPPPPPAPREWQDLPLTPGDWVYGRDGAATQALFGPPASEALFILRCDPAERRVVLTREGASDRLEIRTSSASRTLPATARTDPLAYASASLPASDPLLDAIVFSRGRFSVEAAGGGMLILPAWPEPARVIEDCRG